MYVCVCVCVCVCECVFEFVCVYVCISVCVCISNCEITIARFLLMQLTATLGDRTSPMGKLRHRITSFEPYLYLLRVIFAESMTSE